MISSHEADIEALLTFLSTDQGGRRGPARSGYRAQFYIDGEDFDAEFIFSSVEWAQLGEPVQSIVRFLSPDLVIDRIAPGTQFHIREGNHVVASGEVHNILSLSQSARRMRSLRAKWRQGKEQFDKAHFGLATAEIKLLAHGLLTDILQGLVNGDYGALDCTRFITRYGHELQLDSDPDFSIFVGIDSETIDLPIGDERKNWDESALASKDVLIADYEKRVIDLARNAASALLLRLNGAAAGSAND